MEKFAGTVQKRIGLLISIIGLVVLVTNLMYGIRHFGFSESIVHGEIWLVFIVVIIFVISVLIENQLLKIVQILVILTVGVANVIEAYEQFYGPGLFLAGWLLMRQYGFLDKHKIPKNIVIITALVVLSQISAFLHTDEGIYAGFSTLWYALFLSALVLIIWRDMIEKQESLKKENKVLYTNYHELEARLEEIEDEQKPFDLRAHKISPAEERVVKVLTVYRASNREIAERLDISEATVKLHLYNVYNKLGVDSRFSIIDLCKYNF